MDWMEDVQRRCKRKNKMLFTKESELLQSLMMKIDEQDHGTLILWLFELAEEGFIQLEATYPFEIRPQKAIKTCKLWAYGDLKMPVAKRAILNCHAFAKEITNEADIALCHAIGQACSVVHTRGHAIGYPIYELTSIVHRQGIEKCRDEIEKRMAYYMERLEAWRTYDGIAKEGFATFIYVA